MQPSGNESNHWAEPLYDACAAELVLYGRAMGLGHAEAEDLLHDTFRAILALEETPKEPRFYLIRSFRNRALNYRRTLWRRIAREFESSRWFDRESTEHPEEDRAARALTRLPNEQREVIVLKLWHDLTFDEIAELLGISANTAAGRYRYGLQKLRNQLGAHDHGYSRSHREEAGGAPEIPTASHLLPLPPGEGQGLSAEALAKADVGTPKPLACLGACQLHHPPEPILP
ncbi:MAG: sigma-70 family RNA polymerase sigma factor [Verrucomicrobiales bacterium]|nr:sigma-70 family RNA polymerase sigma factor [Verrucomicrobiales bacterium]